MFGYTGYDLIKNLKLAVMSNIEQLSFVVDRRSYTHLISEICGGEARATQLAVRQRYKTGPNFDLVCNVDLTKKEDAHQAYVFFDRNKVLVAVMAPICSCFGPISHMLWKVTPEAMKDVQDSETNSTVLWFHC